MTQRPRLEQRQKSSRLSHRVRASGLQLNKSTIKPDSLASWPAGWLAGWLRFDLRRECKALKDVEPWVIFSPRSPARIRKRTDNITSVPERGRWIWKYVGVGGGGGMEGGMTYASWYKLVENTTTSPCHITPHHVAMSAPEEREMVLRRGKWFCSSVSTHND